MVAKILKNYFFINFSYLVKPKRLVNTLQPRELRGNIILYINYIRLY
nr:MAG TPA: hypothetical protein [Caudoviricetes sp.]